MCFVEKSAAVCGAKISRCGVCGRELLYIFGGGVFFAHVMLRLRIMQQPLFYEVITESKIRRGKFLQTVKSQQEYKYRKYFTDLMYNLKYCLKIVNLSIHFSTTILLL